MRYHSTTSFSVMAWALLASSTYTAAATAENAAAEPRQLEEILITSQRREVGLQDSAVAVSAVTGASLEKDRIYNYSDLARSVASLSYTENSPLDQEFNIRGITNTRLDAPSADQSIGIFIDDVYVGRSGLLNADFYDIERVEVVRGPQGVLLGRNVVGGAISIITAKPEEETSAHVTFGYGNYNAMHTSGYITGSLSDSLTGRFSFQARHHDGYNHDILHDRDLDNLDSIQMRGQLAYAPDGSDFSARLIVDYMKDSSNGIHRVAIADPNNPGLNPWSTTRAFIAANREGGLSIRESLPEHPRYKGDNFDTPQGHKREALGLTLQMENKISDDIVLTSITGYRDGDATGVYDQSGAGPDSGFGVISPFAFSFPVNEEEKISQFTQELRLTSDYSDSRFDWILGAYYQHDKVDKYDKYWGEIPVGLPSISGESHWDNVGKTTSYAAFGQVGYQFADAWKLTAGLRYSRDKKSGTVTGIAVETGDQFFPNDTVSLTPIVGLAEGESFTTEYGESWGEFTPQAILEFTPTDNLMLYVSAAKGYKGGGFEDTPANAVAAQIAYDPETVTSYEVGAKWEFLDGRARLNTAAFTMDYKNLQVTQTDDGCLCNITDNAADAKIKGIETELQFVATDFLYIWAAGTILDTEYKDFIDSNGLVNTGNKLQRTPNYQFNIGAEVTTDFMDMPDALQIRANYSQQGKLYWLPDNFQYEDSYGLLDARITLHPADSNWSFSIWGKNLTDKLYRTNIIAFLGDEVSTLGTPRTYGIELSLDF
ncbi:TonB-dependent receptor [Kordiimonas pumila]|uniref:TonB-dependent receptor n=1 Tax=Kordiimonas pumila TaxID=2161677 RepID=A0ABV7D6K1_9PROT|nr:TonB-dependent receptor [Kordiimonas pumila]